jgi:hypothetical protein
MGFEKGTLFLVVPALRFCEGSVSLVAISLLNDPAHRESQETEVEIHHAYIAADSSSN